MGNRHGRVPARWPWARIRRSRTRSSNSRSSRISEIRARSASSLGTTTARARSSAASFGRSRRPDAAPRARARRRPEACRARTRTSRQPLDPCARRHQAVAPTGACPRDLTLLDLDDLTPATLRVRTLTSIPSSAANAAESRGSRPSAATAIPRSCPAPATSRSRRSIASSTDAPRRSNSPISALRRSFTGRVPEPRAYSCSAGEQLAPGRRHLPHHRTPSSGRPQYPS